MKDKFNFDLDDQGKLKIFEECKEFNSVKGNPYDEFGECSVAIQLIPFCKNVIEIGAGKGKVSHMINKMLSLRGLETQHIAIEMGNGRFRMLERTKRKYGDKFTPIKKNVMQLVDSDYAVFNEKPDCLFVDCEGCLHEFQTTDIGKNIFKSVRFIVNEMDSSPCPPGCDIDEELNDELRSSWKSMGFVKIAEGYGCKDKCACDVWFRDRQDIDEN